MIKELNSDELFLVGKMVDGDIDSFKYFFDKYYNDLCNFVNIYLHDEVLAEEIVQDIFVYFWENKEKIKISGSVKSYLYSASKYKSLNLLRNLKNQKRIEKKIGESEVENYYEEQDSYLDSDELKQILNTAIENLSPKCREIFLLSKQKNLSNKQIAAQLNVSVKTVESQMTIAFKKLRNSLMPYRGKIFLLFLISLLS